MRKPYKSKICQLCEQYKITRQIFKSLIVIEQLKLTPFERIQTDIVGPIRIKSREQKLITIQDNCTKQAKCIVLDNLKAK